MKSNVTLSKGRGSANTFVVNWQGRGAALLPSGGRICNCFFCLHVLPAPANRAGNPILPVDTVALAVDVFRIIVTF